MAKPASSPFEPLWTFETAIAVWTSARSRGLSGGETIANESLDDLDFAEADAAETYLLDTVPRAETEAIAILEVVMAQSDFRVDGRDRAALGHIRAFLAKGHQSTEPRAPSPSILRS